jgi:hypothetical protein
MVYGYRKSEMKNHSQYLEATSKLRVRNRRSANALTSSGGSDGVVELAQRYSKSELKSALTVAKKYGKKRASDYLKRAIIRKSKK